MNKLEDISGKELENYRKEILLYVEAFENIVNETMLLWDIDITNPKHVSDLLMSLAKIDSICETTKAAIKILNQ